MGRGEHAAAGATLCFSSPFIPNVIPGSLQGPSGFFGTHKVSYVARQDKLKWREQRTDLCASLPPQRCARVPSAASPPRASPSPRGDSGASLHSGSLVGSLAKGKGLASHLIFNVKTVAASSATSSNRIWLQTLCCFDESVMRIGKMLLNREENVYNWKHVSTILLTTTTLLPITILFLL